MEDSAIVEKRTVGSSSEASELEALTTILGILQRVDSEARERILQAVTAFLRIDFPSSSAKVPSLLSHMQSNVASHALPSFSEDRSISPKQFMLEKQPRTDVEKVACLAYYLTHYRDTPYFKTLDISKLNTEAAQVKFANPTVAVANSEKQNYLVAATRGNKQLSALGEQFVQALPDREKARAAMANVRPRRKNRKSEEQNNEE